MKFVVDMALLYMAISRWCSHNAHSDCFVSSVVIVQRHNFSAGLQEVFGADVSTPAFAKFCLNWPPSEQFSTLNMLYLAM